MESHDDKDSVILTSPGRMIRGIIIIGITLAVGAAIVLTFFDAMFANPPPVTHIKQPSGPAPTPTPAPAGTTTIAILAGASAQGSPDYDPDDGKVPLGNKVIWENRDTLIHTATSGTGTDDPNSGKAFDTGFLDGGSKSPPIEIKGAKVGDSFNYFCQVHPYMTSKLTIVAAEPAQGGQPPGGAPAGGPALNILEGAAVQGAPDFDPDPLTVKKGDKINVVNKDTNTHTVTDGTEPGDAAGKLFDTGFLEPGATFSIDTSNLAPATYDYFCQVHPFMKGKLTVE